MKAILFSGTTEGKEIAKFLSDNEIETIVCVATEYGKKVMEKMPYIDINVGRLEIKQMKDIINNVDFVIDATHPYATQVTKNIKFVCDEKGIEYIRLLREENFGNDIYYVDNIDCAIKALKNSVGNIFVSTGSKELDKFTAVNDYKERIIARVLPVLEAEEKCKKLEIKNVIYKKGPFSFEENIKDFKKNNAKWLITKSSGKTGGFIEKINAAKYLGMNIIVIKRPVENSGMNMQEVKKKINIIRKNEELGKCQ